MCVVATLVAVAAVTARTSHDADIVRKNAHGATDAMQDGLGGQGHAPIATGLAVVDHEYIEFREIGLDVGRAKDGRTIGHGARYSLDGSRLHRDGGVLDKTGLTKKVHGGVAVAGNHVLRGKGVGTNAAFQTVGGRRFGLNGRHAGLVVRPVHQGTKIKVQCIQNMSPERSNGNRGGGRTTRR